MLLLIFLIAPVLGILVSPEDEQRLTNCFHSRKDEQEDKFAKGCSFASALLHKDKSYAHNPTCAEACNDAFSADEDKQDCISGCNQFKTEPGLVRVALNPDSPVKVIDFMHNMFMNLMKQLNMEPFGPFPDKKSEIGKDLAKPEADDGFPHLIIKRIRIFIPNLDEDNEVPHPVPVPAHISMHSLDTQHHGTFQEQFTAVARRVVVHPVFTVLICLLIALIMFQVVLCALRCCRRQSRSHAYIPLPTYEEAALIKVPLDDEMTEKLEKKSAESNQ